MVILFVDVLVAVDTVLVGGLLVVPTVLSVATSVVVGEVVCTVVLRTSEIVDSPVVAGFGVVEATAIP